MALKIAKWFLALLSLFVVTFFAVRIYNSQRGLPLDVWHTYVPQELSKTEIDAADWEAYLEAEAKIFASLRPNVSQRSTRHSRGGQQRPAREKALASLKQQGPFDLVKKRRANPAANLVKRNPRTASRASGKDAPAVR